MSAPPEVSDRAKAQAYLERASVCLRRTAAAYRTAWQQQRETEDALDAALEAIQRAYGQHLPGPLRAALESFNASTRSALLLTLDLGDDTLRELEKGARQLEDVATAARRVAEALAGGVQ